MAHCKTAPCWVVDVVQNGCKVHVMYVVCVDPWEPGVGALEMMQEKMIYYCMKQGFYLECGTEVEKIHLALGNASYMEKGFYSECITKVGNDVYRLETSMFSQSLQINMGSFLHKITWLQEVVSLFNIQIM